MAYIQKDRVKETTTTNGTGAVTLAGAVAGFQAFSAVMSVADTCYYVIVSATGTDWETGTGTYSSASVLTRTTVLSSSNSGNAVSFTSGTKDVFMGPIANQVNDIAHGGTGATTAADARTNLGVSTGTVTSVSGAGTVSGLTLTGTVTSSGSLTLGGTLSAIPLATGVSGTLPVANGGTGVTTSTGTTNVVLSNSPTLVTPLSNTLNAVPVVSGLTASVTAASSSSGILTYTATNTFTAGRTVSVTGLITASGTTLNIAGMTIATASATQFTVVNATVGVSSGTGTATAGGNTLADAASNAVTAGPGGNRVIKAGDGVGVGKGGDIELRLSSQGSSGGNGGISIFHPSGVLSNRFTTNNVNPNLYMTGNFDVTSNINSGTSSSGRFETYFVRINNASYNAPTAIIIANTGRIDWSSNSTTGTNLGDTSIGRAAAGVLKISLGAVSTTTGGSLSFPSTTTAIAANTNDLALTASAFQRLNCTAASSLTGIAPPSGGTHVDGRMIRVYNVGTANLTLTHNSGLSTTANRYWNSTAADIVLATNDYAELIYDSTSNGSGISGWRVS